jgi:hypothetical protein
LEVIIVVKKTYEEAIFEVITFEAEDVITNSDGTEDDD